METGIKVAKKRFSDKLFLLDFKFKFCYNNKVEQR